MEVESEIYAETDFQSKKLDNGNTVSKFVYMLPYDEVQEDEDDKNRIDNDGDMILKRLQTGSIEIEHKTSTGINLVGYQVWRGALLLADFIIHNRQLFSNKRVLELGSGVGLTSIVAAKYAKEVICTDVDLETILQLIQTNIDRNTSLLTKSNVKVMELNFMADNWSPELNKSIKDVEIIFAADVIYHNDLTDAFVRTVEKLLQYKKLEAIYVALEKRFVFLQHDSMPSAPMYEHFLYCMDQLIEKYDKLEKFKFQMRPVALDFPQFFEYERVKDLVLFKIFPVKHKQRKDA